MELVEILVELANAMVAALEELKAKTGNSAYASLEAIYSPSIFVKVLKKDVSATFIAKKVLAVADILMTLANAEEPSVIVDCDEIFEHLAKIHDLTDALAL